MNINQVSSEQNDDLKFRDIFSITTQGEAPLVDIGEVAMLVKNHETDEDGIVVSVMYCSKSEMKTGVLFINVSKFEKFIRAAREAALKTDCKVPS